jgi:hypothetical protein
VRVDRSASICAPVREVECLWILWTVWTSALRTRKKRKKIEPTCEAAAPAYVGSVKGKGLRLPFLCVQVIGHGARKVEPHPSEPFE